MEFLMPYVLVFGCGVVSCYLWFMRSRQEPANRTQDQIYAEALRTLSARVTVLENKKMPKVEMVEITDAMKQIMKEHQEFKKQVSDFAFDFNTACTRIFATFKPWIDVEREKKKLKPEASA